MLDPLYRLLAWLSPAYPIGAFSYSHGIETAVEEGFVKDRASLVAWLRKRAARAAPAAVDGALFAAAWRAAEAEDWPAFDAIAERAAAWRGTSEMALESRQQGGSFLSITARRLAPSRRSTRCTNGWPASWRCRSPWRWPPRRTASPSKRALERLSACLHRQPDLGRGAHRAARPNRRPAWRWRRSKPRCRRTAEAALAVEPLDEVGTSTPLLDWCSLRHETQYTRLFRS